MKLIDKRANLIVAVVFGISIAVAVGILLGQSGPAHSSAPPGPLPFGTPEAEWMDASGQPIPALMPSRVAVSALDGSRLRDADGRLVTAPHGDLVRGEIAAEEAERQSREVSRLQLEDACRRGIGVPIGGGGAGATFEESMAAAQADLAAKLKANGGKPYRSAC